MEKNWNDRKFERTWGQRNNLNPGPIEPMDHGSNKLIPTILIIGIVSIVAAFVWGIG